MRFFSERFRIFMIYDLQKASLLKRVSAWILDMILLLVLVTGLATVFSAVLDFDSYTQAVAERQSHYESQYAVQIELTQEEYEKLTPEQIRTHYENADHYILLAAEAFGGEGR